MLNELLKKMIFPKRKSEQRTSILAQLLAKEKGDASPMDKGIPPLIPNVRDKSEQRPKRDRRYLLIAVPSLAIVLLGIGGMIFSGRLKGGKPPRLSLPPQPVPRLPPPPKPPPYVAPVPVAATAMPGESPRTAVKAAPLPAKRADERPPVSMKKKTAGVTLSRVNSSRESAADRAGVPARSPQGGEAQPKIDTAASGALLYAARAAEQAGDWRWALTCYQRALKIDPGNYRIMNNAAAVLNNLGLYQEGAQQAEHALEKKQEYVPAMINAAIAHSSLGETREALRFFAAAAAADPGNNSLAVNLGIFQERSGMLDDALATYAKPAAVGEPNAQLGMGRIHERRGNRNEAADAYRRAAANRNASPAVKKEARERFTRISVME